MSRLFTPKHRPLLRSRPNKLSGHGANGPVIPKEKRRKNKDVLSDAIPLKTLLPPETILLILQWLSPSDICSSLVVSRESPIFERIDIAQPSEAFFRTRATSNAPSEWAIRTESYRTVHFSIDSVRLALDTIEREPYIAPVRYGTIYFASGDMVIRFGSINVRYGSINVRFGSQMLGGNHVNLC